MRLFGFVVRLVCYVVVLVVNRVIQTCSVLGVVVSDVFSIVRLCLNYGLGGAFVVEVLCLVRRL